MGNGLRKMGGNIDSVNKFIIAKLVIRAIFSSNNLSSN